MERIAGDDFDVVSIIPEGASAESYEPTPQNMRDAITSDLFFCIGLLDVWISPANGFRMSEKIAEELCRLNPDKATQYRKNKALLQNDIDLLYFLALTKAQNKRLPKAIIYHPALTYMADCCFFEQIAIEKDGKEPSAAYTKEIIEIGRKNGVKRVFYQSQLNPESVKTIADEIGATPTEFNPLAKNWLLSLKTLIEQIYE